MEAKTLPSDDEIVPTLIALFYLWSSATCTLQSQIINSDNKEDELLEHYNTTIELLNSYPEFATTEKGTVN